MKSKFGFVYIYIYIYIYFIIRCCLFHYSHPDIHSPIGLDSIHNTYNTDLALLSKEGPKMGMETQVPFLAPAPHLAHPALKVLAG